MVLALTGCSEIAIRCSAFDGREGAEVMFILGVQFLALGDNLPKGRAVKAG